MTTSLQYSHTVLCSQHRCSSHALGAAAERQQAKKRYGRMGTAIIQILLAWIGVGKYNYSH